MGVLEHFIVAVCGYVLAMVLQAAGARLSRADSRRRRRTGVGLRVAAGLVATITTTSWLLPAALSGGFVGGVFLFLLLFVFVPFVVAFLGRQLGRLRARRGAAPSWPAVLIAVFALACLLPGTAVLADGLMHLTGLAQPVELRVTDVNDRKVTGGRGGGQSTITDTVSGDYVLDGTTGHLTGRIWMSLTPLPREGDTIPVTISRLWPTVMIESHSAAWVLVAFGTLGVAAGAGLLGLAIREKQQAT